MSTARSTTRLFVVIALASVTAGCGHAWPPAARGGMAERTAPMPAPLALTGRAIDQAVETGAIGPAAAEAARDQLVQARREGEAGLEEDAEASALAPSMTIGGADITSPAGRQTCLKAPCK